MPKSQMVIYKITPYVDEIIGCQVLTLLMKKALIVPKFLSQRIR